MGMELNRRSSTSTDNPGAGSPLSFQTHDINVPYSPPRIDLRTKDGKLRSNVALIPTRQWANPHYEKLPPGRKMRKLNESQNRDFRRSKFATPLHPGPYNEIVPL